MSEQKIFQTRIKNRIDTITNWESDNPVLLEGEIAIVQTLTDDIKIKVGDGLTNFKQLKYISGSDVVIPPQKPPYIASSTPPDNTSTLWIDESVGGVIKYYDVVTSTWKPTLAVWGKR